MKTISWRWLASGKFRSIIFIFVLMASWSSCGDDSQEIVRPDANASSGSPKKPTLIAPEITCGSSTEGSIDLKIKALGTLGAPSGFSVQWMTAADYETNGWDDEVACAASFSGNAFNSNYNLQEAGDEVTIRIGDLLMDNGASTDCIDPLICETEYVFRVFAHAKNTYNKSLWTENLSCSTEACGGGGDVCVYGHGWFKNHGNGDCANPQPKNSNLWPATTLKIGDVTYSESELCSLLWQTYGGTNNFKNLMKQLVAVRMNLLRGTPTTIQSVVNAAEAWLKDGQIVDQFDNTWITSMDDYLNGDEDWNTTQCVSSN